MHPHLKEVLFTREQIAERVKELAEVVSRDYEGKNPLVVGILKGSIMFTVDLLKELSIDAEVDLWMLPVMVMGFHLLEKLEF